MHKAGATQVRADVATINRQKKPCNTTYGGVFLGRDHNLFDDLHGEILVDHQISVLRNLSVFDSSQFYNKDPA